MDIITITCLRSTKMYKVKRNESDIERSKLPKDKIILSVIEPKNIEDKALTIHC